MVILKSIDFMAQSHTSAHDHAAKLSPRLRTIALVVVSLAFVMDLLDSTIVNVAIPTIQHNLGASYSAIQWIVAGYSLAFALLLVTGGRMGDVFGYKKLFLFGIAGFTLASLFSGVAPNVTLLIVARLLQGSMAALMVPQVMSLMQIMYKPEERGAINGLFGGLGGVSASLGPIIGGLLIKANVFNLDWRPIFLINVPVGIFGFFMALKYLPEGKSPHPLKLDITGTFLIMITLFLLAFPLIQGREYGWPTWSIIMLIGSIPALAVFIYWQKYKERTDGSPLVLLSLFKKRTFSAGLFLNMFFEAAMAGFFLTLALMLQIGLGFSPVHAALTGLPIAIAIAFTMAVLGEKLIPKLGRKSLWIGSTLMALGILYNAFIFHHFNIRTNSWELVIGLLSFGVGMGFSFGSMFAAVLNDIDASHAGSASGTLNAVQQVGGAIGIALIGVVFFGQLSSAAPTSYNTVAPKLQTQLVALHIPSREAQVITSSVKTCFVARSKEKDSSVLPASCKILDNKNSTKQISGLINKTADNANAINFANAFKWSALFDVMILTLTFVVNFLIPKHLKLSGHGA
jgi:EmrB/QacA subfamily drug resistance transporter